MFIAKWVLWVVGVACWLTLIAVVSRPRGSYDVVAPFLGLAVLLAGISFVIGLLF